MLLGWVGFSQRCSLACLNLLNDMMSLTSEELSRSDLSFGCDIFFSSDTWQVFPKLKSQHCLGWLVRDTFLEQNCLVIVIEKALPWMVSYSAKSLKMIFVPTFPFGVGRFFEQKKSLDISTMSIPWKDFPPKNLLGAKCQPCHFPTKPTRTAPCMAPPVAPNPGPAAPPAPAAPPVPATAPATAPAVPQAEPQGGPVGSQMEGTSKIWESLMNPIMFVVRW